MTIFTITLCKRQPTDEDNRMWIAICNKTLPEIIAYAEAHADEEMDGVSGNSGILLSYLTYCVEEEYCPCLGCAEDATGMSEDEAIEAFKILLDNGWVDVEVLPNASQAN